MQLVIGPDKRLSTPCTPCGGDDVDHICNEMLAYTRNFGVKGGLSCAGLAANQLGFDKRICVVRIKGKYKVFIDPEITDTSGHQLTQEQCFSWPGRVFDRERAVTVWVRARNVKKPMKLSGLPAICIQHEIDHLDGKEI